MMIDHKSAVIAIGIILSLIYYRRTGRGCGGLVSAGVVALHIQNFPGIFACVAASLAIWPFLEIGTRLWGIHGRERIGMAMLLSLFFRLAAGFFLVSVPWIGWVVPGLIAADIQNQGPLPTFSGLVSVSVLTSMASDLAFSVLGMSL